MFIDRIYFPVKSLGYGNRICIWTVGCPHKCHNCSNPELWDIDKTKNISLDKVMELVSSIDKKVDGITITGGEPFIQYHELLELVRYLKSTGIDDIVIYTGYTLNQLTEMKINDINEILESISVLIDGRYIEELNDNKPLRGSSNQNVHIIDTNFKEKYDNLQDGKRKVQNIFYSNNLISIGIPVRGFKKNIRTKLSECGVVNDSK